MKSTNMDELLLDGYTRKYAKFYLDILEEEKNSKFYDKNFLEWSHNHGFRAEVASIYNINDQNYSDFLTDYDYYRIWPINSWNRIWINDKMTLKYMLADTEFGNVMPKYFYYTALNSGKFTLVPLLDNEYKHFNEGINGFKNVLKEEKIFACKPCNGSTSVGFFKLSYNAGKYYKDDKHISETQLEELIFASPNYVFTEYLYPDKAFANMNSNIHTLRLVTINQTGIPKIVGGYFRIPHNSSGSANFKDFRSSDDYNIVLDINPQNGQYGNAKCIFANKAVDIQNHPDNGVSLTGVIKDYNKLTDIILGVAERFNTIEYMGFDIGITDKGFKCMEINSHPGIGHMQLYKPFFLDEYLCDFYKKKISQIDNLSDLEKRNRIGILR